MENNNVFIARQPILGKNQEIYGYELLSRKNEDSQESDGHHDMVSDSKMLFNIVSSFGLDYLLGGKIAFLNCTIEALGGDYLDLISPSNLVLEIPEIVPFSSKKANWVAKKLQLLKSKGYRFACDEFVLGYKYKSWLSHIDFVKIQACKYSLRKLDSYVAKAKDNKKDIIADKVEDLEKHKFFRAVNAQLYQGYYYCKPTNLSAKIVNPSVNYLIELINLTIKKAKFDKIEELLLKSPNLAQQLQRYMQSLSTEMGVKPGTFKKSLEMMGHNRLFKWLSVLFSTTKQDELSDLISKKAVVRSKFMELLGQEYLGTEHGDKCFVVGMFSLLDGMLNVPLRLAVESMDLPQSIKSALLEKTGEYSRILTLVEALERNDWIEVLATAKSIKIPEKNIHEKYNQSVVWADKLVTA